VAIFPGTDALIDRAKTLFQLALQRVYSGAQKS
jgi:hypothetical protein